MSHISDSRDKLLQEIVLNGEIEQFEIPKIIGISRRHTSRILKQLEEIGLIQVIEYRPTEGRGPARKVYGLTLRGLLYTLSKDMRLLDKIDIITKTNSDLLPIIFEKIDFLKKNNIYETFNLRFRLFIANQRQFITERLDGYYNILKITEMKPVLNIEEEALFLESYKKYLDNIRLFDDYVFFDLERLFQRILLLGTRLEPQDLRQRFILIAGKDEELRVYIYNFFVEEEKKYSELFQNARSWLKWYKDSFEDLLGEGVIRHPE
jgi:hypothetical protein